MVYCGGVGVGDGVGGGGDSITTDPFLGCQ